MQRGFLLQVAGPGLALAAGLMVGCPQGAEDIDLTERGVLTLTIERSSESAIATVTASVQDNSITAILNPNLALSDDQTLAVNSVPLTATILTSLGLESAYTATIEAVDAPDTYAISFDNLGVLTSVEVEPPEDFSDIAPSASSEVSTEGLDLSWEALDDGNDTILSLAITGSALTYASDGTVQTTEYTVSFGDLADDGAITIGAFDLAPFLAGEIRVTLTRRKVLSQKMGFAEGTITLSITRSTLYQLVEPTD